MLNKRKFLSFPTILAMGMLTIIWSSLTQACSLVFYNKNQQAMVFARSMDLFVSDQPKLLVLPAGLNRQGQTKEHPLKWQSKYGSVVVTIFNSDAVSDGMNTEGLAAHLLYLHGTQYEARQPQKSGLSNLLWAQYMLDNYKTVDAALAGLAQYQIQATVLHGKEWPIHLALEDATGDSAIIEYINGKVVIHHGSHYRVMTNEPSYSEQLANLKRYKLFGGNLPMPGDIDPLSRFVRASSYLKTLPQPTSEVEAIAETISVIRTTMVPFGAEDTSGSEISVDSWPTRWISAGDLTHKVYYFNSTMTPNIIWVDLNSFNFKPNSPTLILDPTEPTLVGDVSKTFKQVSN